MTDKKKTGRPKIHIDFEKVKYDFMCGCSGAAIADELGIHHETLANIIKEKTGMSLSDFSHKMRQKGNDNIHRKQYETAMAGGKESISLLIWLGKQRLGQSEKVENKNETFDTITVTIRDITNEPRT